MFYKNKFKVKTQIKKKVINRLINKLKMYIVVEQSVEGEKSFKLFIQPDDTCAIVKAKIQDKKGK